MFHSIAILDNNMIKCWGYNKWGQCDVPEEVNNIRKN
jgi:alpha-tubulin suppressor-like RCC1 family protein